MTTVAASKVKEFDIKSLEKIAYGAVAVVPTREPNDQYRLGYQIWTMLTEKGMTIEQAIKNSGARLQLSEKEAARLITEQLKISGITL